MKVADNLKRSFRRVGSLHVIIRNSLRGRLSPRMRVMAMRNDAGQRAIKPWGGGFIRLSQVSGTRVPGTEIELRNTRYKYKLQPNPRSTTYPSTF